MKSVESTTESLRSPYANKVVRFIFTRPIFRGTELKEFLRKNRVTSNRLLTKFVELGVLHPAGQGTKRKRLFIFRDLIKLL